MSDPILITYEDGVRALLACGHYSEHLHPQSSVFDYPEDAIHCFKCNTERQLHVTLQTKLYTV
jgi:hypothetical protein